MASCFPALIRKIKHNISGYVYIEMEYLIFRKDFGFIKVISHKISPKEETTYILGNIMQ